MTDNLILVGQVGGAFGVRGEVKITTFTGEAMALVAYSPLLRSDGSIGLTLTGARPDKKGLVARAKEIATKEQADAMRGLKLFVPRERLPEPDEDEFYLTDLIGLEVRDASGATLGRVKSVPNFGAGDLLEITPATGGQTWFLAFTRDTVPELHIAGGWLLVAPPAEDETEVE
ncbi:MAG TPA: ribosome maturation factor RimM [Brevundimonas sp.]|jgi:16S rRNA processing protein RimM|uniref:ribosome maturation factor RimM n=1 Tax=Brevundimonas sp. TaxID=1871086 RepID=UPI002B978CD5|nr:ribosome maturation factor RimM [Brevundimonas sp.]HRH19022.1 ribosome maturation factor RimM [Brevundimonas sp.]